MARIAIILALGEPVFLLVFWWIGLPHDEIIFMLIAYAVMAALLFCLLPISMAAGAVIAVRINLNRIYHGRDFDRKALRRASWALRNNRDLRELADCKGPSDVSIDLLRRIAAALPNLESRAIRRFRIMTIAMIVCMVAGSVCRFMGSLQDASRHTHHRVATIHQSSANFRGVGNGRQK